MCCGYLWISRIKRQGWWIMQGDPGIQPRDHCGAPESLLGRPRAILVRFIRTLPQSSLCFAPSPGLWLAPRRWLGGGGLGAREWGGEESRSKGELSAANGQRNDTNFGTDQLFSAGVLWETNSPVLHRLWFEFQISIRFIRLHVQQILLRLLESAISLMPFK